ncbi:MAG: DUF520 family protein [Sulfuritalea sp.]|nr:DUF520 family protein [Sulfuritalea sp.]
MSCRWTPASANCYDFKGTSARAETEREGTRRSPSTARFRIPAPLRQRHPVSGNGKEGAESTKRLDHGPVETVGGNKAKQELKIKVGIEQELAKQIVKMIRTARSSAGQHHRATL